MTAALSVDLWLQETVQVRRPPGVVRDYFNAAETFGNGFGVAMVVLTIMTLDATRRVQISRLLTASLGAGIAADVVKLFVERTRPHAYAFEPGATAWDTFTGWAPMLGEGSSGQSFPSAHTACAFGLAATLAILYPRGSRLFYFFAAGVAAQRVFVGAHYLSDVIVGATIGVVWAQAVCLPSAVSVYFDRFESWWSRRFGWRLPHDHPTLEPVIRPVVIEQPLASRRAA